MTQTINVVSYTTPDGGKCVMGDYCTVCKCHDQAETSCRQAMVYYCGDLPIRVLRKSSRLIVNHDLGGTKT